jgi:uncharacterized protein with HEPN domain
MPRPDSKRDPASLLDIAHAARQIIAMTEGLTAEDFRADILKQSAILYQLLVFGEAVKRLSASIREKHSEVDWRGAAQMRDKVIHQYDKIDIELVWSVISDEIPRLRSQVLDILNDLGIGESGPLESPR